MFLLLFGAIGHSQNIPNGYYNLVGSINKISLFVHNDTIILPVANGMMYAAIDIGVIDKKKKRINFIVIPVEERSPYAVYGNKKMKSMRYKYFEEDQRLEILFNLPFNNYWNIYIKTDEPYKLGRSQGAVDKHINDLTKSSE